MLKKLGLCTDAPRSDQAQAEVTAHGEDASDDEVIVNGVGEEAMGSVEAPAPAAPARESPFAKAGALVRLPTSAPSDEPPPPLETSSRLVNALACLPKAHGVPIDHILNVPITIANPVGAFVPPHDASLGSTINTATCTVTPVPDWANIQLDAVAYESWHGEDVRAGVAQSTQPLACGRG